MPVFQWLITIHERGRGEARSGDPVHRARARRLREAAAMVRNQITNFLQIFIVYRKNKDIKENKAKDRTKRY